MPCEPGHQGPDGGPCEPCAAGKFKAMIGNNSCVKCDPGKTSLKQAATNCSTCGRDTFSSENGTECTSCPLNTVSETSSSSVQSCKCNLAYSGPDGGPCTACLAGKYKAVNGSSACIKCAGGEYSSAVGQSICVACAAGKYSPVLGASADSTCIECPPAKFSAVVGASKCTNMTIAGW